MSENKKILLLTTGGTIASLPGGEGLEPQRSGVMERELNQLRTYYDITVQDVMCLDSSNIRPEDWQFIARHIFENRAGFDGIVVSHGTDTMAYTASALSFMLKGLNKPVILTGSQIPLCETRSDGRDNLITSMMIAGEGKVREVCIYFGSLLLRGNRATKYSADGMQAFVSPNYPPLATAGISIQYNESAFLRHRSEKFECRQFTDVPIGVLKIFPGIRFDLFESIISDKLKGIVLETFGSGNMPDDGNLLPILEKARQNGTVVTVCSQCPQATVDMSTYEAGSALQKAGAACGRDMTTEAAVAKLYYLFSVYSSAEQFKFNLERDIRGELSQKFEL